MSRLSPYFKRLKDLEIKHASWVDDDSDGFLTACGAMPGETAADALRRTAAFDWQDYRPPYDPEGEDDFYED